MNVNVHLKVYKVHLTLMFEKRNFFPKVNIVLNRMLIEI